MTDITDRDEWLAWRRRGIGASDIAMVARISPFGGPWAVWADKTGRDVDDDVTEPMTWGTLLEPVILDEWVRRGGHANVTPGHPFVHHADEWIRATPDGFVFTDRGDLDAVIDVKNTGHPWRWDTVPIQYDAQVQWQMIATGAWRGILVVLHGGRRLETYDVPADPELMAALLDIGRAFWFDHVLTDTPPPVIEGDAGDVAAAFPQSAPGSVQADHALAATVARLRHARRVAGRAKDRVSNLEAIVKAAMADHERLVAPDGRVLATWKTSNRRAYTVDAGTTRRFIVKEPTDG